MAHAVDERIAREVVADAILQGRMVLPRQCRSATKARPPGPNHVKRALAVYLHAIHSCPCSVGSTTRIRPAPLLQRQVSLNRAQFTGILCKLILPDHDLYVECLAGRYQPLALIQEALLVGAILVHDRLTATQEANMDSTYDKALPETTVLQQAARTWPSFWYTTCLHCPQVWLLALSGDTLSVPKGSLNICNCHIEAYAQQAAFNSIGLFSYCVCSYLQVKTVGHCHLLSHTRLQGFGGHPNLQGRSA